LYLQDLSLVPIYGLLGLSTFIGIICLLLKYLIIGL
jgi:hypothetical protein